MNIKQNLICCLLTICLAFPLMGHAFDPFAGLPDPTRHKQTPKKTVKKVVKRVELKPLVLQSTLTSEGRSYAIINGKPVGIGERIEGATLLAINPFDVVVERQGQKIRLQLLAKEIVQENGQPTNKD